VKILDVVSNEVGTIDRDQVGCAVNCVNMDDSEVWGAIVMNSWMYYPHASILIHTVANLVEPLNKGTWICDPIKLERKKTFDSCDFKPSHPFKVWIDIDKHTIITGSNIPPEWTSSYLFMSHAANATGITWGIESRSCRIKDTKPAIMPRTASSGDILGAAGIVRVELREQKVTDKVSQVRYIDFIC
jgi:hypothetical protein